jgi:hypothetical protein
MQAPWIEAPRVRDRRRDLEHRLLGRVGRAGNPINALTEFVCYQNLR